MGFFASTLICLFFLGTATFFLATGDCTSVVTLEIPALELGNKAVFKAVSAAY